MNCPVTKPKEWQSIMSATSLSEEEAWAKARSDAARLAEHILSVMEPAATSVYSLTPGRVPSWVLSESLALVADDHRVITVPAGEAQTFSQIRFISSFYGRRDLGRDALWFRVCPSVFCLCQAL